MRIFQYIIAKQLKIISSCLFITVQLSIISNALNAQSKNELLKNTWYGNMNEYLQFNDTSVIYEFNSEFALSEGSWRLSGNTIFVNENPIFKIIKLNTDTLLLEVFLNNIDCLPSIAYGGKGSYDCSILFLSRNSLTNHRLKFKKIIYKGGSLPLDLIAQFSIRINKDGELWIHNPNLEKTFFKGMLDSKELEKLIKTLQNCKLQELEYGYGVIPTDGSLTTLYVETNIGSFIMESYQYPYIYQSLLEFIFNFKNHKSLLSVPPPKRYFRKFKLNNSKIKRTIRRRNRE